jgi:hypothetical protein
MRQKVISLASLGGTGLLLALALVWLTFTLTTALYRYGVVLFVIGPFVMGLVSAIVFAALRGDSMRASIAHAMLFVTYVMLATALGLLCLAMEGLVCVLMAAPLVYPVSLVGALLGIGIARVITTRWARSSTAFILAVLLPLASILLSQPHADAPQFKVTSRINISAPPEVVWNNVVTFSDLPTPDDWVLRTGIAYPVRARIEGSGIGAVRYCEFSTGPFVEPITTWDAPRRLAFAVTENPAPMQEWTFWRDVHPPHLDGFFVSQQGEFLLVPTADGGTRLEGSTWYRHNLGPAWYWRLWSDAIIHRIHLQVLAHVKTLSETDATGASHTIAAASPRSGA